MLLDPRASPGVSPAQGYGIHVECPVIDGAYLEVRHPVDAFHALARICAPVALRGREPAFVADGDHVLRVYGLDIARHGRDPRRQHGGTAGGRGAAIIVACAAGLVAQLPGEDSGGVLVGVDDLCIAEECVVGGAAAQELLDVETYRWPLVANHGDDGFDS